MPSISSYFSPCSTEFHAGKDFKNLSCGQRFGVGILTALAAICSLGILATPIFRLLVGRFTKLNADKLPPAANKTNHVAQQQLPSAVSTVIPTPSAPSIVPQTPSPMPTQYTKPMPPPAPAEKTSPSSIIPPNIPMNSDLQLNLYPDQITIPPDISKHSQLTKLNLKNANPVSVSPPTPHAKPTVRELYRRSLGYAPPPPTGALKKTTQAKRAFVNLKLQALDKVRGEAIDNGDCFFHAFAQTLNVIRVKRGEKPVTVPQLRQQVAKYVEKETPENKWVMDLCNTNTTIAPEGFERYKKEIQNLATLDNTPLWGHPLRDGRILCELYNVNLRTYSADLSDIDSDKATRLLKNPSELRKLAESDEGWMFGADANDCVTIKTATETIEIATYPGHFMPVFNRQDLQ